MANHARRHRGLDSPRTAEDDRIHGTLANVGYHISDTTDGSVLKQHGIEPAPDRKRGTTWKTFLKAHWEVLAAIDGFVKDKRFVLTDRDAQFSTAFRTILKGRGTTPLRLPPKSPNLNAHLERFHLSKETKCLDRMIFFGEQSPRMAVRQYLIHYLSERNHQGRDNAMIDRI